MQKVTLRVGIAILLCLFPLTACKKQDYGSATEQAAREFSILQDEMLQTMQDGNMSEEEAEEIDRLLTHFAQTADARYATPQSGLTMLHLACLYKHAELARCLLLDGANPHAALRVEAFCDTAVAHATPLQLAVLCGPPCREKEMLTLVQHLLNAGAVVQMQREGQLCAYENVYLTLLRAATSLEDDSTATPNYPTSIGKIAAESGWKHALEELIQRRAGNLTEGDKLLLHVIAANFANIPDQLDCAKLLLEQGVAADTQDSHGATPLFVLTTNPSFQSAEAQATLPLAELLLQHGANPHQQAERDPEYPGFTPYDFMLTRSDIIHHLKESGHQLQAPPLHWDTANNLPREICRAHLRESAVNYTPGDSVPVVIRHQKLGNKVSDDTAAQFDNIARILAPDSRMIQDALYVDALRAGIELMARIDADRTARLLADMPLWQDALAWRDQHPHALAALQALADSPGLVLPRELILHAAEAMEEQGQHDMAATMVELLGRNHDTAPDIERLKNDPRPAISAGAYQAQLLKEKLPAARCYAVRDWLQEQGREADTPVLRKALLLTSQEDLWLGTMSAEDKEELLAAMLEVGAPKAAAAYRAIAAALGDPDKLDELTSDSHVWKFELECATARYILTHRRDFLQSETSEKENTD